MLWSIRHTYAYICLQIAHILSAIGLYGVANELMHYLQLT